MGNTVSRGSLVRVMVLATVFALALSLPALANDSLLDTIQRKGKMIVGIQTSAPPASMVNAKGQVEGFEVDVAKAIGRRLGVSVEFKQLTDATRIPSVQQGATDIVIATMTHTRERDKVVDFSITYFVTGQRILVPSGSPIKTIDDLAGKKVGTARGSTSEQNIREAQPKARILSYDDSATAFVALQRGAVDAISTDESVLLSLKANAKNPSAWQVVGPYFSYEPFGIAMRQDDSKLRDAINSALMEMWESGEFEHIYNRWYGPETKYELPLNFRMELWP